MHISSSKVTVPDTSSKNSDPMAKKWRFSCIYTPYQAFLCMVCMNEHTPYIKHPMSATAVTMATFHTMLCTENNERYSEGTKLATLLMQYMYNRHEITSYTQEEVHGLLSGYLDILNRVWPSLDHTFWADVFCEKWKQNGMNPLHSCLNKHLLQNRGGTVESDRVVGTIKLGMFTVKELPNTRVVLFSGRNKMPDLDMGILESAQLGDKMELASVLSASTNVSSACLFSCGECTCMIRIDLWSNSDGILAEGANARMPTRKSIQNSTRSGEEVVIFPGTGLEYVGQSVISVPDVSPPPPPFF